MGLKLKFRELYRYRITAFIVFTFCMMASLSFFITRGMNSTMAASTAGFKAGNIISDAVMSDYNSMTKDDIQRFLTAKNPCNDTDYQKKIDWEATHSSRLHYENGHFICISEERFNGVNIGSGQTAAEIIYEAAQTYKINPQVLLVLLQKEQGLITDTWPTDSQYRIATGFGCPDTAACDTKYYGFKNQINNAAALYREVLDGGWSNYPAYKTVYIQYNQNAGCGGSKVYIENRATSALYRYTPYQPNSSALNAGYGTGDTCGAYGNRNFYLYFSDWFGDPQKSPWSNMDNARIMITKTGAKYTNVWGNATESSIPVNTPIYFTTKTFVNGQLCLGTDSSSSQCVLFSQLEDNSSKLNWVKLDTSRTFYVLNGSRAVNYQNGTSSNLTNSQYIYLTEKITMGNGDYCMRENNSSPICYFFSSTETLTVSDRVSMSSPRVMLVKNPTHTINTIATDNTTIALAKDQQIMFSSKYYINGDQCLTNDTLSAQHQCVRFSDVYSMPNLSIINMDTKRELFIPKGTTYYDLSNATSTQTTSGQNLMFAKKTTFLGELYVQLQADNGSLKFYKFSDLKAAVAPWRMDNAREMYVPEGTVRINLGSGETSTTQSGQVIYFTKKVYYNDELYLQAASDEGTLILYKFSHLKSLPSYISMDTPRNMTIKTGAKVMNTLTGATSTSNTTVMYFTKKFYFNGEMYLATNDQAKQYQGIKFSELQEM